MPSAVPSRARPVVKLKCPEESSITAVNGPASTALWSDATPDSVSVASPAMVTFVLVVTMPVGLVILTTGGWVSVVKGNANGSDTLPLLSVATNCNAWLPSVVPFSAKEVVKLNGTTDG